MLGAPAEFAVAWLKDLADVQLAIVSWVEGVRVSILKEVRSARLWVI